MTMKNKSICEKCKNKECTLRNKLQILDEDGEKITDVTVEECSNFKK